MDNNIISGTSLRLDRWYRKMFSQTKLHLINDVLGDNPNHQIETRCGLIIDAGRDERDLEYSNNLIPKQRCGKCLKSHTGPNLLVSSVKQAMKILRQWCG